MHLQKPMILCAASTQYGEMGFDQDLAIMESLFPGQVMCEKNLTTTRLRDLLLEKSFEIVHLVSFVDQKTGDLVLNDINFTTFQAATPQEDRMPTDGLARLTEFSKTQLVVLATCDSLLLAAKLARVTNVIAAPAVIEIKTIVAWEQCFYQLLAKGQSLSNAVEMANSTTNAPMIFLMKKDLAFSQ